MGWMIMYCMCMYTWLHSIKIKTVCTACRIYIDSDSAWWYVHVKKRCVLGCTHLYDHAMRYVCMLMLLSIRHWMPFTTVRLVKTSFQSYPPYYSNELQQPKVRSTYFYQEVLLPDTLIISVFVLISVCVCVWWLFCVTALSCWDLVYM